jgi:hypothetical protein
VVFLETITNIDSLGLLKKGINDSVLRTL